MSTGKSFSLDSIFLFVSRSFTLCDSFSCYSKNACPHGKRISNVVSKMLLRHKSNGAREILGERLVRKKSINYFRLNKNTTNQILANDFRNVMHACSPTISLTLFLSFVFPRARVRSFAPHVNELNVKKHLKNTADRNPMKWLEVALRI